jgi:phosphoglycolate phosphatase/pyrophosphatase PpaX
MHGHSLIVTDQASGADVAWTRACVGEDSYVSAPYRLFAFDFDGTIADTGDCVFAALTTALTRHRLPLVDRDTAIALMGLPLPQVFRELTANAYTDDQYDQLVVGYRETYRDVLPDKTAAFPGIRAALEYLTGRGAVCTVATSKKTEFAVSSARHLGLDSYFAFYIGDDLITHSKPDPQMLHHTLAKAGVTPAHAVMVGDAVTDIQMGQAIGMDTIAVTWGAHQADALAAASPTHIIDTAAALTRFA